MRMNNKQKANLYLSLAIVSFISLLIRLSVLFPFNGTCFVDLELYGFIDSITNYSLGLIILFGSISGFCMFKFFQLRKRIRKRTKKKS